MTTSTVSPTEQIKSAIEDWCQAQNDLLEFRAEYAPLFDTLARLEEDEQLAKKAITETLVSLGIDYATHVGVEANLVKTDRGYYDPEQLPQVDAVFVACVLAIDKAAVKLLVKSKEITHAQAEAAWVAKPAAPYVKLTVKAEAAHE